MLNESPDASYCFSLFVERALVPKVISDRLEASVEKAAPARWGV